MQKVQPASLSESPSLTPMRTVGPAPSKSQTLRPSSARRPSRSAGSERTARRCGRSKATDPTARRADAAGADLSPRAPPGDVPSPPRRTAGMRRPRSAPSCGKAAATSRHVRRWSGKRRQSPCGSWRRPSRHGTHLPQLCASNSRSRATARLTGQPTFIIPNGLYPFFSLLKIQPSGTAFAPAKSYTFKR